MKINVPAKGEGGQGDWELCPSGTLAAVLVDVVDLGEVDVDVYGKPGEKKREHHAKFVFQTGELMTTGKPFLLSTWGMKVSLHDKAKMRKVLAALNGKDFEVGTEIDPDAFIGCNCLLDVIHKKSSDGTKTFANIGNVMAPLKGMAPLTVNGYVRVQDRPKDAETAHADGGPIFDDSDIPFGN